MITFSENGVRFNCRIVGVAIHNSRVLLHRAEWDDFWSLPGGRAELLEPSAETLRREMCEELDAQVAVERLLWIVENFFEYRGERFHELALYFLMTLPEDWPRLQQESFFGDEIFHSDGEGDLRLIYRWFPLASLDTTRLYPTFLRQGLQALPATPLHVMHHDAK